jgi:hypothetical protein
VVWPIGRDRHLVQITVLGVAVPACKTSEGANVTRRSGCPKEAPSKLVAGGSNAKSAGLPMELVGCLGHSGDLKSLAMSPRAVWE